VKYGVRARIAHARELAECYEIGEKPPSESTQILRDWAVLKKSQNQNENLPWHVECIFGIVVKRFKYKYRQEWWFRDYNDRKAVAKAKDRESGEVMPR